MGRKKKEQATTARTRTLAQVELERHYARFDEIKTKLCRILEALDEKNTVETAFQLGKLAQIVYEMEEQAAHFANEQIY